MAVSEPNLFISTSANDKDAVGWLNAIFLRLVEDNVSDLHILSSQDDCIIRIRGPEGMREIGVMTKPLGEIVSDRIRSRANISLSDRRTPVDGRFRLRYEDRAVDVRVAITPNIMGFLIVCRILDQARSVINLDALNLDNRYLMALRSLLTEPNGIFFITGPTGSGKTTTLYALVNELNDGTRNIITVENPVEYVVPGIAQINVDHNHTTFANALRTVLRQDPDVILIGEIRDVETAQIAVQAAMTGHLVLATLHTNSAVQAVFRMIDLGVDPKMLSVAMRGVCAQRLMPAINGAPDEDDWVQPSNSDVAWMKLHSIPCLGERIVRHDYPVKGYLPTMELFLIDDSVRTAISQADIDGLNIAVRKQPWYDTLAQSASFSCMQGKAHLHTAKSLVSTSDTGDKVPMRIASSMIDRGLLTLTDALNVLNQQIYWRLEGYNATFGAVLKAIEEERYLKLSVTASNERGESVGVDEDSIGQTGSSDVEAHDLDGESSDHFIPKPSAPHNLTFVESLMVSDHEPLDGHATDNIDSMDFDFTFAKSQITAPAFEGATAPMRKS